MDEALRALYSQYVAALKYYNESAFAGKQGQETRALPILPEADFPGWWAAVSRDRELQERWLERFADPAGALERARQQITAELQRIPIRRAA